MLPSIAKSQAIIRDLKDKLDLELSSLRSLGTLRLVEKISGVSPATADAAKNESQGKFPQLFAESEETAGTVVNEIILQIEPVEAIHPDVFGNHFRAFAPHVAKVYSAGNEASVLLKLQLELGKFGIEKIQICSDEALTTVTSELIADIRWVTKGI